MTDKDINKIIAQVNRLKIAEENIREVRQDLENEGRKLSNKINLQT